MYKRSMILVIVLLIAINVFAIDNDNYVKGELIIRVINDFTNIGKNGEGNIQTEKSWFNQMSDQYDIYYLEKIFRADEDIFNFYYTIKFDSSFSVHEVGNDFLSKNGVRCVFPNYKYRLASTPNDEFYSYQWPLTMIKSDSAWNVSLSGQDTVVVGVLDTGVDVAHPDTADFIPSNYKPHPDLEDNMYLDSDGNLIGLNPSDKTKYPFDSWGHGTHIAGIVGAVTDNNTGIASLAGGHTDCNIKIMPVRTTAKQQHPTFDQALRAFEWTVDPDSNIATDDGADIINMSLGCNLAFPTIPYSADSARVLYENVLEYVTDHNCLIIAAAMNDNSDISNNEYYPYPAISDKCIAVAATDKNDNKASYSNWADWINICAPGGEHYFPHDTDGYLSTCPTHEEYYFYAFGEWQFGFWDESPYYDFAAGTSIATPLVTSLAALIKVQYPDSSIDYLKRRILGTSDYIYDSNMDYLGKLGSGRINAYKALTAQKQPNLVVNGIEIGENGIFECSETIELTVELRNWWKDANNVNATLTTTDGMIVIEDNYAEWVNIEQDSSATNVTPFVITDNSIVPREEVVFTLEVNADNMETKQLPIKLEIKPNFSNALLDTVELAEGKQITQKLLISDIDLDEEEEIIICASKPNISSIDTVYIYDNGEFINLNCNGNINSMPATGDIDNNGYEEIVTGNDNGVLTVWDYQGNQQFSVQLDGMIRNSIIIEDVNGDGQMEIIASTNKFTQSPYGMEGIYIINPQNHEVYSYDNIYQVGASISCADIDGDVKKEIIVISKNDNTNCILKVLSVDATYQITSDEVDVTNTSDYSLSTDPIIANIDENNGNEILFGINQDSGPPPGGESGAKLYCYYYENGQITKKWSNNTFDDYFNSQLLVFNDLYSTGLNIIVGTASNTKILDFAGNITGTGDIKPVDIISDLDDDGFQEFVSGTGNYFRVMDGDLKELEQWSRSLIPEDYFQSVAVSNIITEGESSIFLITEKGKLYSIPITFPKSSVSEWPQYQNNARNTGSYYQPLPEDIESGITIKHNAIIEKEINSSIHNAVFTVEPGNEILFKPNGYINFSNVEFIADGNDTERITFRGLCKNDINKYWQGIEINSGSQAVIKLCQISNAKTGILSNNINAQIDSIEITKCDIGISLSKNGNYDIFNNVITNCSQAGIKVKGSRFTTHNDALNIGYNTISGMENGVDGIYVSGCHRNLDIYENTITGNNNGITLEECGAISIYYNEINANNVGMMLLHSGPGLKENIITDNDEMGIFISGEAFPVVEQYNLISNNGLNEIYMIWGDPLMQNGHNDIINNGTGSYLMYKDGELPPNGPLHVEYNWWGQYPPDANQFYPLEYYQYMPADQSPNVGDKGKDEVQPDSSMTAFFAAAQLEEEEKYSQAKSAYKDVISLYPESKVAKASLRRIFSCEKNLSDSQADFLSLGSYYSSLTDSPDTLFALIARNLAINCNVEQELYDVALNNYDDILVSDPLQTDSVFTVINVMRTLMLADSCNGNKLLGVPSRVLAMKPKNMQDYTQKRNELLSKIGYPLLEEPGIEPEEPDKVFVSQNFPNPFNNSTEIEFAITPNTKKVELKIYNIKGQLVKRFDIDNETGFKSVTWDGTDNYGREVGLGVYFYRLKTDTKEFVKKMLLIK